MKMRIVAIHPEDAWNPNNPQGADPYVKVGAVIEVLSALEPTGDDEGNIFPNYNTAWFFIPGDPNEHFFWAVKLEPVDGSEAA